MEFDIGGYDGECSRLSDCKLVWEIDTDGNKHYYLELVYIVEDENSIRKVTLPRVMLPINNITSIDTGTFTVGGYVDNCIIKTNGYGESVKFKVEKTSLPYKNKYGKSVDIIKPYYHVEEIIEKKYKEMTLEEIERKLGCNIKLVSEKEKKDGC